MGALSGKSVHLKLPAVVSMMAVGGAVLTAGLFVGVEVCETTYTEQKMRPAMSDLRIIAPRIKEKEQEHCTT
jgi:hypothetical protein